MIWLVQLVFDCHDPDAIMQFWGRALEYRNPLIGVSPPEVAAFRAANPQFDGRGRIDDNELRRMPVYIQRVPEQKSARNRVRLEIGTPDVARTTARVLELGATHVDSGEFADVEGNEFTVSPIDTDEVALTSLVIDANDPDRLLAFWSAATGYRSGTSRQRCDPPSLRLQWQGDHFEVAGDRMRHITGAGAAPGPAPFDLIPGLRFAPTSEPKRVKNRIHVDVNSTDVDGDRERLVDLGATVLQWDTDQVLADPEGNEFCLSGRRHRTP